AESAGSGASAPCVVGSCGRIYPVSSSQPPAVCHERRCTTRVPAPARPRRPRIGEDVWVDPQTVACLSAPRAWSLLQSLPEYDEDSALALGTRLRAEGYEPALVAALLTQSRLRAKSRTKFGDRVDEMLLTPDGVEQATRWQLAARHAQRFAAAGVEVVWDLGCGLGGDALALADAGLSVELVDADP